MPDCRCDLNNKLGAPPVVAEANLPARLTQDELAAFWRVSPRTLERWRARGRGPAWIRLEGRVLYRLEDVCAYERARLGGR